MGIEPTQPAWKAGTLPLSYTRVACFPGVPAHAGALYVHEFKADDNGFFIKFLRMAIERGSVVFVGAGNCVMVACLLTQGGRVMNRARVFIVSVMTAVALAMPFYVSAGEEGDAPKRPRAERMKEARDELKDLSPEERKARLEEMREKRLEKIGDRWGQSSDEDKAKFCRRAKERCAEKEHHKLWPRCAFAKEHCPGIKDNAGGDAGDATGEGRTEAAE